MKPKQKAINLFNSYVKLLPFGSNVDVMYPKGYFDFPEFERAKQCALIAVDEILNGYEFDSLDIENKRIMDNINYWDVVKKEINNL